MRRSEQSPAHSPVKICLLLINYFNALMCNYIIIVGGNATNTALALATLGAICCVNYLLPTISYGNTSLMLQD